MHDRSRIKTSLRAALLSALLAAAAVVAPTASSTDVQAGHVYAWGRNAQGQLGVGSTVDSSAPVEVGGLGAVTSVSAGGAHSLALASGGTIWSWGSDGGIGENVSPVQIPFTSGITAISAGGSHSLALRSDGRVLTWGSDSHGQLGRGSSANPTAPAEFPGTSSRAISAGDRHSLSIELGDGSVWAWGDNASGQLGDGSTTQRVVPVETSIRGAVAVSAGGSHSLALKSDGTVWAWGRDVDGQLGDGPAVTDGTVPVQVIGLSNVIAIAAGESHSMALKADGSVWTWGRPDEGQLGRGSGSGPTNVPAQIGGAVFAGITAISAGARHGLAIRIDGVVFAWGLGFGSTASGSVPVVVPGISRLAVIDGGGQHTVALADEQHCDGVDDDADGLIDEGFTDTDADGQADCVDPDDDNDGASDDDEIAAGSDPLFAGSKPAPGLSVTDLSIVEGNSGTTGGSVTVRIDGPRLFDIAFSYSTVNDTATAPTDYKPASGSGVIPAGARSVQIPLTMNGDVNIEPTERFLVRVDSAPQATITDGTAAVTVVNDDDTTPPVIDLKADVVVETRSSSTAVSYSLPISSDKVDGRVTPTCVAKSGSVFFQGVTAVSCEARDRSGNVALSSFSVVVRQPSVSGAVFDHGGMTPIAVATSGQRVEVRVDAGAFEPDAIVIVSFVDSSGGLFELRRARALDDGSLSAVAVIPLRSSMGLGQVSVDSESGFGELDRTWQLDVTG